MTNLTEKIESTNKRKAGKNNIYKLKLYLEKKKNDTKSNNSTL
jgi:hypothetical protein